MRYEGKVYRPPSEANSLILQATLGCSYNRCSFCAMYLDKKFRMKPLEELEEDIRLARAALGSDVSRVFLADGDALIMGMDRLKKVLLMILQAFPDLRRISSYATPQALLRKSVDDLKELKELKLSTLYLGVESGSSKVLERIRKGVDPEEMIEAGQKPVEAGIKLSTMIILGAGSCDLMEEHARESARVISSIGPRFISTLSMMVAPGTPLHDDLEAGRYTPPNPRQTLEELRLFIAGIETDNAIFRSNHVSNFLPLAGTFMKDKTAMLKILDDALNGPVSEVFPPRGY